MHNAYILYNIYIIKGQKHCFEMLLPFFCFLFKNASPLFLFLYCANSTFTPISLTPGRISRFISWRTVIWMESPWFILYMLMGKFY